MQVEKCYDIGDQAYVRFTVTPSPLHPSAESTAFTVTVRKPDGTGYTIVSPDSSLTKTTNVIDVWDSDTEAFVSTLITTWIFEFPDAFDVGSERHKWIVNGKSTAGVISAVDTEARVKRPAIH